MVNLRGRPALLLLVVFLLTVICQWIDARPSYDKIVGLPGIPKLPSFAQYAGYLRMNDNGSLTERVYSWNKLANVIYLETPAGTGFSHASDRNITTSDDQSADDNYEALEYFLKIFPEFKGRELFIAGQSFAGVYIPLLAKRLVKKPLGYKFQGIAIGNGLTNNLYNDNSVLYFARYHGVIDEIMWEDVRRVCCPKSDPMFCMFTQSLAIKECKDKVMQIHTRQALGLDFYNILRPCVGGVRTQRKALQQNEAFDDNAFGLMNHRPDGSQFYDSETCIDYGPLERYLNRDEVQAYLHVTRRLKWRVCTKLLPNYKRQHKDQTDVILQVMRQGVKVLIYNGDLDAICNFIGGDWFVTLANQQQSPNYARWLYTNEKGEKQIGGYTKAYKDKKQVLTFATVRGSGHMVPRDTPASAFEMMRQFIINGTLQ